MTGRPRIGGGLLVAIDGPAGAGKSTVANAVAAALGLAHLDTGAMYRSVTLAALRTGIDPGAADELTVLARRLSIEVGDQVHIDGVDVTEAIRGSDVDRTVSQVSAHPGVRAEMVRRQREWVEARAGGVVEGRDIGSVVFPDADLKVFLTASGPERARRRGRAQVEVDRRDELDSTRTASPLAVAPDAMLIDTTQEPAARVVDAILARLTELERPA